MRNLVLLLVTVVATSCSIVKTVLRGEDFISVIPDINEGIYVLTQSHFERPNAHYLITNNCSLQGKQIRMPANCTITFIDGSLNNGIIVGVDTYVNSRNKKIFGDDLILKGTFSAKAAKPIWFGIKPDCILDSDGKYISGTDWVGKFASLLLFNRIQLDDEGIYYINGHLTTRSNQYIEGNNAIIKWRYLKHNALFQIGSVNGYKYVEDVKLSNINIIGNKLETDDVTEFCHGVSVGYASDIVIDNVSVFYCRGDGIYVGTSVTAPRREMTPKNISLRRVRCEYNHRQGLSVTRVDGLCVDNSDFSYTSGTSPGAGIDIEPNDLIDDEGTLYITECLNISISNCRFEGNEGYGVVMGNSACNQDNVADAINNISISKCIFQNNKLYISGGTNINVNSLEMQNSPIEIRAPGYTENLTMRNVKTCSNIEDNELSAVTFILYSVNNANSKLNNIVFDNLDISGFGAYGINIPDYKSRGTSLSYIDRVTIQNSTINDCAVPIYVGSLIKNKEITSNTYVPRRLEKLTKNQQLIRELVPSGIYVYEENE